MAGESGASPGLRRVLTLTPQAQERMLDRRYRGKHAGEACVLLGGGPSVADANLRELLPCRFVAVNAANWREEIESVRTHIVAGVVLDEALLLREIRRTVRTLDYPLFVGNTPQDTDVLIEYLNALGIFRIPTNHTEGLGDSFGRFSNGGNSGFAALQLAIILGFRTIGLLGYDGMPSKGPQHFHDEYGVGDDRGHHLEEWCRLLDAHAPLAELMGVQVLNLSPDSRLEAFPKVDAACWRKAVAKAGESILPSQPTNVLRTRFGGRMRLPFPAPAPDPRLSESTTCFGGARNVAEPARYRPLPNGLTAFVTPGGPTWCELRMTDQQASTVVAPSAWHDTRAALAALSLVETSPGDVEAWLHAALGRAMPGMQAIELRDWLSLSLEDDVDRHAVVLRTTERDVAVVAAGLSWLSRAAEVVTCAANGAGCLELTGGRGLLRLLSDDWRILEYRMSGSWLSVALRSLKM